MIISMTETKDITWEEFEEAVRKILLAKPVRRAEYENRKPTEEERNERWRLEKREPQ